MLSNEQQDVVPSVVDTKNGIKPIASSCSITLYIKEDEKTFTVHGGGVRIQIEISLVMIIAVRMRDFVTISTRITLME